MIFFSNLWFTYICFIQNLRRTCKKCLWSTFRKVIKLISTYVNRIFERKRFFVLTYHNEASPFCCQGNQENRNRIYINAWYLIIYWHKNVILSCSFQLCPLSVISDCPYIFNLIIWRRSFFHFHGNYYNKVCVGKFLIALVLISWP